MSTRAELVTLIRALAQVETHEVSAAELTAYMNEGYLEVVSNRTWPWCYVATPETIAMIVDTSAYAVASAMRRIISVVNVDQGYDLESVAPSEWARRQAQTESTSRPVIFMFNKQKLFVWPPPSTTDDMNVYYYEHPEWASGDTIAPPFDAAFHSIIADWTLHRVWEQEEDFERSDDYRSRFEMKLNRMARFYNNLVQDTPKIYGRKGPVRGVSNMPWLDDAAVGGAT